jgi:hypothetical protein
MKGRLMISVAAAALAVGTALVYAEPGGQPGGKGTPEAQTPDTPPGVGEKKGQPKTEQPGSKQGTQRKENEPKEKAEPKSKTTEPKATEPKSKNAEPKATQPKSTAEPKANDRGNPPERPGAKGTTKGKEDATPRAGEKSGGSRTTVNITTEQRTEIRQTIIKQSGGPRVDRVDFDVRIGVHVPRTIKVAVLPPRVIEIYPEWRGYRYFIVGERIIIIEPDDLVIVYIIEA